VATLIRAKALRIDPLDEQTAFHVGVRIGITGVDDGVDGHVALLAARVRAVVFTSDPADIRALDPSFARSHSR
jgi:hypothetical protein